MVVIKHLTSDVKCIVVSHILAHSNEFSFCKTFVDVIPECIRDELYIDVK
jgi:hypothetical protein